MLYLFTASCEQCYPLYQQLLLRNISSILHFPNFHALLLLIFLKLFLPTAPELVACARRCQISRGLELALVTSAISRSTTTTQEILFLRRVPKSPPDLICAHVLTRERASLKLGQVRPLDFQRRASLFRIS